VGGKGKGQEKGKERKKGKGTGRTNTVPDFSFADSMKACAASKKGMRSSDTSSDTGTCRYVNSAGKCTAHSFDAFKMCVTPSMSSVLFSDVTSSPPRNR
jgi:hypothetical protein